MEQRGFGSETMEMAGESAKRKSNPSPATDADDMNNEEATGAMLVSQELCNVILYRGWGAGLGAHITDSTKDSAFEGNSRSSVPVSLELIAAMKLECGFVNDIEDAILKTFQKISIGQNKAEYFSAWKAFRVDRTKSSTHDDNAATLTTSLSAAGFVLRYTMNPDNYLEITLWKQ
ncbi:hypothetical protein AKJ16_DCAP19445 [Drosera capensis]